MPRRKTAGARAVRSWRERHSPKVTQDELGEDVGVDGSYIRHYEIGKQDLSVSVKVRLTKRTGIALSTLLTKDQARIIIEAARLLPECGRATAA